MEVGAPSKVRWRVMRRRLVTITIRWAAAGCKGSVGLEHGFEDGTMLFFALVVAVGE